MKKIVLILIIIVLLILLVPFPKTKGDMCDFPPCATYNSLGKILWQNIFGAHRSEQKVLPVISGDTAHFISFSIHPGDTVSGKVMAAGEISGAYFFEATARGMLLDANKNELKTFPLTAVGEWMTADAVTFNASFDATGITPGAGYVRLANDNASGDPANDKFIDIPVIFY